MNVKLLPFSLIRYQVDLQRQEVVNIGVVLFTSKGPLVATTPGQGKVLALNPNYQVSHLFEQAQRLAEALRSLWADSLDPVALVNFFGHGGALMLSSLGHVDIADRSEEQVLEELLRDLVEPPSRQRARVAQKSRLHTELRNLFREAKILGSEPEDISRHLVVPNYPIDPQTGLFAEFALQNGHLHVTETVDFRLSTPSTKKQEAQAKTLLLVEARARLGSKKLKRYVIVTGASADVQSSLNLLQKYSDDLIVRESSTDWQRYVDLMYKAAKPGHVQ
jgi:hypothetical protein